MGSGNDTQPKQIKTFEKKLKQKVEVLNNAFDDYNLEQIFLPFNGGKDCTVLLHLVYNIMKIRFNSQLCKLLCIYLQPEQPFEEIETFVADCNRNYFPIVVKPGLGTKQSALFRICNEFPVLKTCLMGCRQTDPYCQDTLFRGIYSRCYNYVKYP